MIGKTEFLKRLSQKKYLIGAVMHLIARNDVIADDYSQKIFDQCMSEFNDSKDISDQTTRTLSLLLHKYIKPLSKGWRPAFMRMERRPENFFTAYSVGKTIYCQFKTSDKNKFQETVKFIKTLNGARWIPTKEAWGVAYNYLAVEKIKQYGFELSQEIHQMYRFYNRSSDDGRTQPINPNGLKLSPFKYQAEGIGWLERCGGNAIIADEMGLGKSLQSLGFLAYHPECRPALIICPAFLKYNWLAEVNKFLPDTLTNKVQVLNGFPKKNPEIFGDILICNYDVIGNRYAKKGKKRTDKISKYGWEHYLKNINTVVIDECHYLQDKSALRTAGVLNIAYGAEHVIAMSGTPVQSKPLNFYTVLNLISPEIFGSEWDFKQKYCAPKFNGFGWTFNGLSNAEELNRFIKKIMIRRKKSDVLKDLPAKRRIVIPVEIDNEAEYKKATQNIFQWLVDMKDAKSDKEIAKIKKHQHLIKLDKLKQLAVNGKIKRCVEFIENIIEDEKLVVFIDHHEVADILMKKFNKVAVEVTGRISSPAKKQEAVNKFMNDPKCRLLVGSNAAKEGLTLTAAAKMIILELDWLPSTLMQKEDRIHRIGQTENVEIYYLVGAGTIEEDITKVLDKKTDIMSKVLDGKDAEEDSLLEEIMKKYS